MLHVFMWSIFYGIPFRQTDSHIPFHDGNDKTKAGQPLNESILHDGFCIDPFIKWS